MAKIIGNTTATPMAIPDWNQTDEKKADYIKNKPDVVTEAVFNEEVTRAKTAETQALTDSKSYTDNAVAQKSQVQIITWGDDD